jgi:hypothetical protein
MEGTSSAPRSALSTAELAAQITELAGHLNAANRRWLGLIAEFDRREGWSDSATHSRICRSSVQRWPAAS